MESLQRGFTDNVALDNLFVEIQGSRTANFMYFDDATVAVIKGILGLAPKLYSDFQDSTLPVQWSKTKTIVVKYKELLKLYVKNVAGQENLLKTIEVSLWTYDISFIALHAITRFRNLLVFRNMQMIASTSVP